MFWHLAWQTKPGRPCIIDTAVANLPWPQYRGGYHRAARGACSGWRGAGCAAAACRRSTATGQPRATALARRKRRWRVARLRRPPSREHRVGRRESLCRSPEILRFMKCFLNKSLCSLLAFYMTSYRCKYNTQFLTRNLDNSTFNLWPSYTPFTKRVGAYWEKEWEQL